MEEDMSSVLKRRSRLTACFPWKSLQPRQQVQETSHTLRNSRQQMEKTTWNQKKIYFQTSWEFHMGIRSQTELFIRIVNHLYY